MHGIAAILLAAGQSSRMGAFKPLLPFGDKTTVEASIDYLRRGGAETIIVVLGHRADEVRRRLDNASVSFAINPDPTSAMGNSIAVGVRELPETALATLIAPVDQPAIPASVVASLLTEWSKGHRLVVPIWKNRGGHPVLIDLSFRQHILKLDPNRGLRGFFDDHRNNVFRVPVDSPYVARDMDTWDDYRRLCEEIFGGSPPPAKNYPTKT